MNKHPNKNTNFPSKINQSKRIVIFKRCSLNDARYNNNMNPRAMQLYVCVLSGYICVCPVQQPYFNWTLSQRDGINIYKCLHK